MPSLASQLSSTNGDAAAAIADASSAATVGAEPASSITSSTGSISDRIHSLKSWMQHKTCHARAVGQYFQQAGTCHAEFKEGA